MNSTAPKVPQRLHWPAVMAAATGASAVLLGAMGEHVLHRFIAAPMLDIWQTAVHFQFWHALALAICALSARRSYAAHLAAILCALGIVLFCGSLYALALGAPRMVGAITPLGGLAFVAGWIALGVALYRQQH